MLTLCLLNDSEVRACRGRVWVSWAEGGLTDGELTTEYGLGPNPEVGHIQCVTSQPQGVPIR